MNQGFTGENNPKAKSTKARELHKPIILKLIQGKRFSQIAAEHGLNEDTVAKIYKRNEVHITAERDRYLQKMQAEFEKAMENEVTWQTVLLEKSAGVLTGFVELLEERIKGLKPDDDDYEKLFQLSLKTHQQIRSQIYTITKQGVSNA